MARTSRPKPVYHRHYKQPSLLNSLLFRLSLLNPLNPTEFPMPNSRRNIIIRTVASIAGDIAIGIAVASAAVWIIESAALGLFLAFLVWLLAALAALALSQYVLHPAVKLALDDKKLDRAVSMVTGLWAGLRPHMGAKAA
jgi:VanZ family protein